MFGKQHQENDTQF